MADEEDVEDEALFFISLDEGIGALLGTPLLVENTPLPRAEAVPRVGDVGGRLDNFDPPGVLPEGEVGREDGRENVPASAGD